VPVDWVFADHLIDLYGSNGSGSRISIEDAQRQTQTAKVVLERLRSQPGVLIADEVGMGKTYVAMAVIASVIVKTRGQHSPVVVMVPPGLRQKWQRDWSQFKTHCVRNHSLDWVIDEYAHTPTEFFKLLDNPANRRPHLIFMTTGCFYRGIYDPWVKLAMIRLARAKTRLDHKGKSRLYRWAGDIVRQFSNRHLTEKVLERLMSTDISKWRTILIQDGILHENADDPIPKHLEKVAHKIDWSCLAKVLHDLPGRRPEFVQKDTRTDIRSRFSESFEKVYRQWLDLARWRSPLLVLDEAHHAKNDATRLARLFRSESENDMALLQDKFDRMVFLTATPFQLGHQELIRILRSFKAVRWSSKEAPEGARGDFETAMSHLEQALDQNRLAGRRFDRLWGKVKAEMFLGDLHDDENENQRILQWWRRIESAPEDIGQQHLVQAYKDCFRTKEDAERLLRPWVIRHNRLPHLPDRPDIPRRDVIAGSAVRLNGTSTLPRVMEGLPIDQRAILPFLITARTQGQLEQCVGTRALFAEGLASSYEAFHHTRDEGRCAMDFDDGLLPDGDSNEKPWLVPTAWYKKKIAQFIPSRDAQRAERMSHPKISATVERVVHLWLGGEKVLVFCFYIQTARALFEHIKEEIERSYIEIAGKKLGLDARQHTQEIQNWLARIVHRLSDRESPFYREIRSIFENLMEKPEYRLLQRYREMVLGVLMAYFRSPSFVARYLPLDDSLVRDALAERETRQNVIARGIDALRHAILEQKDFSNQTYLGRVSQFLDFARELAERAERPVSSKEDEFGDEPENPLVEYLDAVSVYTKPRRVDRPDEDGTVEETDDGSYRVMPLVRLVIGETKTEIRDRLMLAFNSPLFPEILISSSVMGEGVDLHRFCRHVIHHDLCWNPSTLEQRTGRLDRVRCKAEVCCRPIEVCEPFISGSADEKMFRVLRDRERWFQIVMGQKFSFDEQMSESLASRVELPSELSYSLTFDLSCWRNEPR